MKNALLLVDIQNDFIPGGALAVPEGDVIVPIANSIMSSFDLVVATRDWHPSNHGSFASQYPGKAPGEFVDLNGLQQILWPDHCVQNSSGAEFVAGLNIGGIDKVIQKGDDQRVDSYSGFFDNDHLRDTGLGKYLKERMVAEVVVMGLATDYCVKFTALDARTLGFETKLIIEGVRGVEIHQGDCDKAIDDMRNVGVKIISMHDV
jgi:nicotinamidase/pyrazinamidase